MKGKGTEKASSRQPQVSTGGFYRRSNSCLNAGISQFLLLSPLGLHSLCMKGWFMVQCSDFSSAKIQGASGVALDPCVLFSALVGCLVSGLAVAGVGGCGCRCVQVVDPGLPPKRSKTHTTASPPGYPQQCRCSASSALSPQWGQG